MKICKIVLNRYSRGMDSERLDAGLLAQAQEVLLALKAGIPALPAPLEDDSMVLVSLGSPPDPWLANRLKERSREQHPGADERKFEEEANAVQPHDLSTSFTLE